METSPRYAIHYTSSWMTTMSQSLSDFEVKFKKINKLKDTLFF